MASRNLFEVNNARNMSVLELVKTYIPTKSFSRMLTAKNQIIVGARGSGKTALAKMISHPHLSKFNDPSYQKKIKRKEFIGIYVSTRLTWTSGLKNKPWQTEEQQEKFFQWRLNIATCRAFLETARSCLDSYVDGNAKDRRLITEVKVVQEISDAWTNGNVKCNTLQELDLYLSKNELQEQSRISEIRVRGGEYRPIGFCGIDYGAELYSPVTHAIKVLSYALDIEKSTNWLMALDEAEFLDPIHMRILNSHMRANYDNLFFKITTTPYSHSDLSTNTNAPLSPGNDFEYLYIDNDPIIWNNQNDKEGAAFCEELFKKRLAASGEAFGKISLQELLGKSSILDSDTGDIQKLVEKYCNQATVERSKRLLENDPGGYKDQISRKLRGALMLRDAVSKKRGHTGLDVFSGETVVIRCADGNPRRFVAVINKLLLISGNQKLNVQKRKEVPVIDGKIQEKELRNYSASVIERTKSEPDVGPELFDFISSVGKQMRHDLHDVKLATDTYFSIEVDSDVSDDMWSLIKRAVALGYLYPDTSTAHPNILPERSGKFRFGYVFAPYFDLLPRKGKAKKLKSYINVASVKIRPAHYEGQIDLDI